MNRVHPALQISKMDDECWPYEIQDVEEKMTSWSTLIKIAYLYTHGQIPHNPY